MTKFAFNNKTKHTRRIFLTAFLVIAAAYIGYHRPRTYEEVKQIQARHEKELFKIPGVVQVGIGKDKIGRYIIGVGIKEGTKRSLIPSCLEGVPVKIFPGADVMIMRSGIPSQVQ